MASAFDIDMMQPLNVLHPLQQGLVGFWVPVPQLQGGTHFFDLSLYRRDFDDWNGTPAWQVATRQGGFCAIDFPGSDDWMDLSSEINLGTVNTIAFWIRWDSFGNIPIASYPSSGNYPCYALSAARWYYSASDGTQRFFYFDLSTALVANTWYLLSVTRKDTAIRFFVNGKFVHAHTFNAENPAMHIGRLGAIWDGSLDFNGKLSDIACWTRCLGDDEVWSFYEESLAGYPTLLNRGSRRGWSVGGGAGPTSWKTWLVGQSQLIGGGVA